MTKPDSGARNIEVLQETAKEAVADAWASIDGKLDAFRAEKADPSSPLRDTYGYYEGYLSDAGELIRRLEARGFIVAKVIKV
jgi:hypothetical protein